MYWVKLVIWEFGAWKTLWTLSYMYDLKKKYKDNIIIIANIPIYFVDFFYNSRSDLRYIFSLLIDYINKTNDQNLLPVNKRILLIIDEIHLYFPSSSFWQALKFTNEDLILLTQCRKRNVEIIWITQELWQVSKRFRVLSPYIRKFYKWFGFYRRYKDFRLKTLDSTDLLDPQVADVVWWWLIKGWRFPFLRYKLFPKRISYYVVGWEDILDLQKKLEIKKKIFNI